MSQRDMSELDQSAALEAYRAAACAEADAQFDERALETQRHKILARLAHLGHPAKVIRFPKAGHADPPTGGVNRRWISVAAAAGLIIGLLGGQVVHLMPQPNRRGAPMVTAMAPTVPSGPTFVPVTASTDDGLLGEIELAMQVRGSVELRALDEFTPLADGR
ncbi:MAG TPA: hypothetical protein VM096_17640 [Vicinamibacterales bacterium]|nr:hypothetical protein [Vicinamibacterales bacterium]